MFKANNALTTHCFRDMLISFRTLRYIALSFMYLLFNPSLANAIWKVWYSSQRTVASGS